MNRIVNSSGRSYRSSLRARQAQETRERILEATARVMATGIANASIPAIAREAGVSVPTVYRNFATKDELFRELYPYSLRRARMREPVAPTSLEDFGEALRPVFDWVDALDDMTRAALAGPAVEEVRHVTMDRRIATTRGIADTIAPQLSEPDRDHLARLLVVLAMSSTVRMLREHLGLSTDEAIAEVEWVVRSVITGAAARQR
jgi:AcrR family transcriptional regulator